MRRTPGLVIILAAFIAAPAIAAGGPAIVSPKNGATVTGPVEVVIDMKGAGAAAMSGMSHDHMDNAGHSDHAAGHAHLIIDSPLPKAGATVPVDAKHVHMMDGETKTSVNLPPGRHTLQLILGGMDHKIPANAPTSAKVTITVK